MAERQSWPRQPRRGDAPGEREAAGRASRAARAASGVAGLLETEQGSPGQKDASRAGTRPAPSASMRSPGHPITWDNLGRSGKTDPGSWHSSFPNHSDPSINVSLLKRVT